MAGNVNEPTKLAPLREEVHCLVGPTQFDGTPSWTLHDPANNRFFRIGWMEHEILLRWSLGDTQLIAEQIKLETVLNVEEQDVKAFAEFLNANQLLYPASEEAVKRLKMQVMSSRKNLAQWLLHNYLFFKIPLFRPDPFLQWLYPYLSWIYSRRFLYVLIAGFLTGLFLVSRQWDTFLNTFPNFFSWQGLAQYFAALVFAKVLHELGHALTAHRYGCRVPSMGVAFVVMYPMLYTDASETWTLNQRSQRLAIGSAGVIAEMILAVLASLLWSFLDDGPLRSAVFLLASSTWIITLVVNISPFMRFDGYYLLCDWMKIENLQPRAFSYSKWMLRRFLFDIDSEPPEIVPANTVRFFLVYSWITWIYRFFLFLGIAWMVYHFFFKALGIILMLVEILWFVFLPIWKEIKYWPGLLKHHSAYRLALIVLSIVLLACVPWQQHRILPAVLKPAHYAELYLPYAAKLENWHVQLGQSVEAGDSLLSLKSSDLAYKAQAAGLESASYAWQLSFQGLDKNLIKQRQIQLRQRESAQTKQDGYHRQIDQLHIHAPMTGVVQYINEQAQSGQWLKAGESLLIIAENDQWQLEAFVDEHDVTAMQTNSLAWFYPESPDLERIACHLKSVESSNSQYVSALMASVYGGPIAARKIADGRLVPEGAQYRVLLDCPDVQTLSSLPQVLRGAVRVESESSSMISKFLRNTVATFRREAGF